MQSRRLLTLAAIEVGACLVIGLVSCSWRSASPTAAVRTAASPPTPFAAVPTVPTAATPAALESPQEVRFEGRDGGTIAEICGAFRQELLSVVKKLQAAGQGLDGYDARQVVCDSESAPHLEGQLPSGGSILSGAVLHFFDGVAIRDERFLVLRRPEGVTVAGPMFSAQDDVGDSPAPVVWRFAMSWTRGAPVLLIASAAPWHSPYRPSDGPDAIEVEERGRLCRFEVARFSCDQPYPMLFNKRLLDKQQAARFKTSPSVDLPPIDPATGTLRLLE
jgi:hypothetical protein